MNLFERIGKSIGRGASTTGSEQGLEFLRKAPAAFIDGVLDMIEAPPRRLLSHFTSLGKVYSDMTPEDQERVKQVARTLVDVGIKAGKTYVSGKATF